MPTTPTTAEKTIDLATTTLRGDIRDKILSEFKDVADTLVRRAIDIVAAKGLPALAITVGKMTIEKSECKGAFECYADDEALLRIRHLQGARAMFVLASPDAFNGEQKKQETDVVGDLAMPKGEETRADEANLANVGQGKANGAAATV